MQESGHLHLYFWSSQGLQGTEEVYPIWATLGTLLYNERNSPLTTLENTGGKDKILSFQEGKNRSHEKDQESERHRVLNSHSRSQETMEHCL